MNLYAILGVPLDATTRAIKTAYRRLASLHHPDKGGDATKFHAVQEAYEVLIDPVKRARYDKTGMFDNVPPLDFTARKELIQMAVMLAREGDVHDLRKEMERLLQKHTVQLNNQRFQVQDVIRKYEKVLKKLRPKGHNFLGEALHSETEKLRQDLTGLEETGKVLLRMKTLLQEGYDYLEEDAAPLVFWGTATNWNRS